MMMHIDLSSVLRQTVSCELYSNLVTRPTGANVEAFETAVAEVTEVTTRLLAGLAPRRQPPKTVPPLRRPEVRARLAAK